MPGQIFRRSRARQRAPSASNPSRLQGARADARRGPAQARPAKDHRRKIRRNVFKATCRAIKQTLARKGAKGRFSEGFQTSVSPHTRAIAAFHAQTATGKLKALMMPATPSGCTSPSFCGLAVRLLWCVRKAGARDRLRNRKCRSFPGPRQTLLQDLAGLNCHKPAERGFAGAQLFGKQADEFASFRGRDSAPSLKRRMGGMDRDRHPLAIAI